MARQNPVARANKRSQGAPADSAKVSRMADATKRADEAKKKYFADEAQKRAEASRKPKSMSTMARLASALRGR